MINIDQELERVRFIMIDDNIIPMHEVDNVIREAANNINEEILTIVSQAIAEISDYAIDIGAEDFITDMNVEESGVGWQISTLSGKTDYSTQPVQMLPKFLEGAQTSESGSLYKVIPVGKKSEKNNYNSRSNDIYSALKRQQQKIDTARSEIQRRNMSGNSERANMLADSFRDMLTAQMDRNTKSLMDSIRSKNEQREQRQSDRQVEYKTASSNQDPTTDWVIPGKDLDMTFKIMEVNNELAQQQTDAAFSIIEGLESEYRQLLSRM